ncbi:hypothetical protein [Methylobacterium sp. NEAU K]|uniref:hypothetical protein n=1 Tax=Methylobacterium sp. NEAU K TaxID=3064946 RepID=UPI00273664B8|nr:hypothetical protein [Methylobacterium sp. NEAU K]MDP4006898.1 hypothetical protein [Methylobacterium sp. NEAU K]
MREAGANCDDAKAPASFALAKPLMIGEDSRWVRAKLVAAAMLLLFALLIVVARGIAHLS